MKQLKNLKKIKKIMKKMLDKRLKVWYNNYSKEKRGNSNGNVNLCKW